LLVEILLQVQTQFHTIWRLYLIQSTMYQQATCGDA
jgi:hypothetical protein